jgi:hypothetical protein
MQISSTSSQEATARECMEPACPLQCPLCSGTLVLLHNSYRCSRCFYHLCASCEAVEPEALNHPIV